MAAIDIQGRNWKTTKILPDTNTWSGQKALVAYGIIPDELKHTDKTQYHLANATLGIHFFEDMEIPCDSFTKSKITIGDGDEIQSSRKNIAKFSSCGCDFTMSGKDKSLTLGASSASTKFPDNLETRAVEALQFVLGQPLNWTILQKEEEGIETIIIRPILTPKGDCRINPPLSFQPFDPSRSVWKLYDKYLSYILNYTGETNWRPLSIFVHRLMRTGSAYIETKSLEVTVDVEGILSTEFPNLAAPSEKELTDMDKAQQIIKESALGNGLKKRISSAIGGWKNPSATVKLKSLLESGIIEEREFKAWKELRNSSTHPKQPFSSHLQKTFDLCDTVITLFYKLIFHTIGYKGRYTDYGTHGWPLKDYPK